MDFTFTDDGLLTTRISKQKSSKASGNYDSSKGNQYGYSGNMYNPDSGYGQTSGGAGKSSRKNRNANVYETKQEYSQPSGNGRRHKITIQTNYKNKNFSSSASDSDSSGRSELSGFKVVLNGQTIHDETEDESPYYIEKFASSELTVGPNAKNISLPSFLE